MDLQVLNVDLFRKLSLAIAIIRNTPPGIKPDVFTRSLAKRLFSQRNRSSELLSLLDEHLLLRQQDLLARCLPSQSAFPSSISLMDLTETDLNKKPPVTNEYEYRQFVEKVCKLKNKKHSIRVDDVECLLHILTKWLTNITVDQRILPIDACLYTIQIIANHLQTDQDKPYHIVLDLLPMIDKFLECILDLLEHTADSHVSSLHQMVLSLASANSCISRILEKLCTRITHYCETTADYEHQFASTISFIDPTDRLFNILHEIIQHRSIFQRRLSQRIIDKLFTFISQVSVLLDGKVNHIHTLKIEGQLQAANYRRSETFTKTLRSYTSSSSSEHSQYQQQKHYTSKAPVMFSKHSSLDYSISQQSQSQYF